MSKTNHLSIKGMSCGSCVGRVERALLGVPGVSQVSVNLATEKASFQTESENKLIEAIEAIKKAGYEVESKQLGTNQIKLNSEDEKLKLIISALLTLPLVGPMLIGAEMLPATIQLLLATPVQFIFGYRFYKGAFASLKARSANMDVLVALGTTAAYALSIYQMSLHSHHLYFESSATIITLVMLGKYFEKRAKQQTTEAIKALEKLRPDKTTILSQDKEVVIPIDQVQVGNVVVLKPGERVPVDGVIIWGNSEIDESMITGESVPVFKGVDEKLTAGSLNINGLMRLKVTAIGKETMISKIIKMVEEAQVNKAPIQKLVDKISNIFVPTIVCLSILTFIGWYFARGDWEHALLQAVAVLVIACPCALGLATPTSIMVGTGAAAKAGVLIKDAQALELTHSVNLVAFDKTGTLTEGKPKVVYYPTDEVFQIIYSIQLGSHHPLAEAVVSAGKMKGIVSLEVSHNKVIPGKGIEAKVAGRSYALASKAFLSEFMIFDEKMLDLGLEREELGESVSYLIDLSDKKILGVISFQDAIKTSSYETIKKLHALKIKTLMISGDNRGSAESVAKKLGIDFIEAEVLPHEKLKFIQKYKDQGSIVAMVGDGINDAPALAQAHVGMAMSTGTDVAMHSAGITLMRGNPLLVVDAIEISKRTHNKIKQNLFWAFIYNVIGIPLAAFGYLNPMIAGFAMAFSSVSVVVNSLLLRSWKPSSGARK